MKERSIVVTGGAGFIGSNLARELAKNNNVIVIDDLSTGNKDNIVDIFDAHTIEFIKGSITDLDLLQKSFQNIDYIFHHAAIPSVPRSIEDPISSNFANVTGTLNVLVAARDNNVKKVVCASSSSVYGDTPTLPKIEEMKSSPLSPYAVGKLTGEMYCQVFHDVYHLDTVSLRYFNVYGPRQDPLSEYAAVIPKFITNVLHDTPPIIYGDGTQTRDFTYIQDVIQANIMAAESPVTGVFNVAGGKRITICELAETIMKLLGRDLEIIYEDPRPGDIKHSLADVTKAKREFGYATNFTIEDGLKETIEWFRNKN